MNQSPPITLLNEQEAAELLGTSPSFLSKNRCYAKGAERIPFLQLSNRCIRYDQEDLLTWVASRKSTKTEEDLV